MVQTVWDSSPILLDWEAGLDRQVEFLQFCLALGNRGLLDLLFVQYSADNIDYIANIKANYKADSFEEDPQQLLGQLKALSVTFLNGLKSNFDTKIDEFSKVKRDNKDELQKSITQKLEALQGDFKNAINTATSGGKDVIMKFPEASRPFAARQYSGMLTAGVTVFREQTSAIKKIVEKIDNPAPRQLPEAVEVVIGEAKVVNQTSADVAIKWIDTLAGKVNKPNKPEQPPNNPEQPPNNPEQPPNNPEQPPNNPEQPPNQPEQPPNQPEQPPNKPNSLADILSRAEKSQVDRLSFKKTGKGWEVRSI